MGKDGKETLKYTFGGYRLVLQRVTGRVAIITGCKFASFLFEKVLNLQRKIFDFNQRVYDLLCLIVEAVVKITIFLILFLYMLPVSFLRSRFQGRNESTAHSENTTRKAVTSLPKYQGISRHTLDHFKPAHTFKCLGLFDKLKTSKFNTSNVVKVCSSGSVRCRRLLHCSIQVICRIWRQVWRSICETFIGLYGRNKAPRCASEQKEEVVDSDDLSMSFNDGHTIEGVIQRQETATNKNKDKIVIAQAFDKMKTVITSTEASSLPGITRVDVEDGIVEWRIRRDNYCDTGKISSDRVAYGQQQTINRFHSSTHDLNMIRKTTSTSSFEANYSTLSEGRPQDRFSDARVDLLGVILLVLIILALCIFAMS